MLNAPFRITFPITKAEQRADGFYITGEATGPEIDAEGERIAPELIERFSNQIHERALMGEPLPYIDAHAKDGVLRELGIVTKAWITEQFHLGVEVRLDEDNPAAMALYKQLKKGKQYGMSVGGRVLDFVDELVDGGRRLIRTYTDVILNEISNTTRPAWTPSLGTVLSKAIDAAQAESSAATGDNLSMEKELLSTQETVEPAAEKSEEVAEATPEADVQKNESLAELVANADVVDETGEEDEAEAETTEKSDEADENEVEKAGRSISRKNADALMAAYRQMTETLQSLGVLEVEEPTAEKTDSQADESTETEVQKDNRDETIAALQAQVEELTRSLSELKTRYEELANTPAADDAPELIERADVHDEVQKALASMTPEERIRVGLRARYGG